MMSLWPSLKRSVMMGVAYTLLLTSVIHVSAMSVSHWPCQGTISSSSADL